MRIGLEVRKDKKNQHNAPTRHVNAGENSNSKARFLRNEGKEYMIALLCQFTFGDQAILCSPGNHTPVGAEKGSKSQMNTPRIDFWPRSAVYFIQSKLTLVHSFYSSIRTIRTDTDDIVSI